MLKLATSIVKRSAPGYVTSREIRSWIFRKVRYKYGVSNSSTSVIDTAKQRAAFGGLRSIGYLALPRLEKSARIVVGYLYQLDPMDRNCQQARIACATGGAICQVRNPVQEL